MWSTRDQSVSFASASTHLSYPRTMAPATPATISERALKLARFAYVRAQGNDPASLTRGGAQGAYVIETVAKAIERAFKDEEFMQLPYDQQEIAAAHLTNQCVSGLRVVEALQRAMMNPYTMATQLKYNATSPEDHYNVFDHIITAHRPTSVISHIAAHEVDSLPASFPN